jgi:GT2 family glycosyltransferase
MNIAVIVLTWNASAVALECVRALEAQERPPDYTLIVDNASTDDTIAQIEATFPQLHILRNSTNLGFSGGMNTGIATLRRLPTPPDIVVLLNQDTIVAPQWLGALADAFADDADLGAAGCKIRYADGTIQHAGVYLEWPRAVAHHIGVYEADTGQYDSMQHYDIVTGAALALRMAALDRVGLFDVGYAPAYYEDVDLCWRLRQAAYGVLYVPQAVLTHHESLSLRDPLVRGHYYNRGRLRYVLKTYSFDDLLGDFVAAEQAFLYEHIHPAEGHALRRAYIDTLLALPDILRARADTAGLLSEEQRADIMRALVACKDALTAALAQRAMRTIDYLNLDNQAADQGETMDQTEQTEQADATDRRETSI